MHSFVNKITNAASGRHVLIFLILSFAVYVVMLFHTIPSVQAYAPDIKIFDLSPSGYSYNYAIKLLSALGDEGRKQYLNTQLTLDFIYPALFSISSSLLLAWVFLKRYEKGSRIFYSCLVPIFAGIFDYLENIQIVVLVVNFPDISNTQVVLSSVFTIAKSALTTIFFLVLLFAFIKLWMGSKCAKKPV